MTWDIRMRNNMFRRLPVEQATGRLYGGRHRLRVVYRTRDLIVLGLGVMIGSGIFKISGQQAATTAGPAVIISFLIAGGVCLLAALSYAELSSIIPVAGSAYSFSYVAFGEVWAWVVGWALVLELLLAASVVARAWSLYATQALADFGVPVPDWLGGIIGQEKGFDLFALGILVLLITMLATGSRMSLRSLWFMVMAKLIVIGLVIATGLKFFHPGNLKPFVPPAQPAPQDAQTVLDALLGAVTGSRPEVFGIWGVFAAAPAIAFAYIGFDLIATTAEETDDAPRAVPRGMITSLLIAVVLYVGVAVAMVGMVSFKDVDAGKPLLAAAFSGVGADSMGKIIDIGAVIALTTVILVVLISLTRVVFSMSRDGLLPRPIAGMSRYKVPSRATLVAGGAAVVMSQTIDVLTLEQMVVIGTLFAFLFVAASVLALRRDRPDLHRPFRVPAAPLTAVATIVATAWLMLNLKVQTWGYFTVWMAVGMVLYLIYGRRKSQMRLLLDAPAPERPVAAPMVAAPPPGGGAFLAAPQTASWQSAPAPYGPGPRGGQASGGYLGLGQQASGAHGPGVSPAEPRQSPPPAGPYPAGRHSSGQYSAGTGSTGQYPVGRHSGQYSHDPAASGPATDPYTADPDAPGPYSGDPAASGQYAADPGHSGPWQGEEHPEPPSPGGGRHRR
ncbi:APC family permease [Actinomadura roseirufa]|uniref:APC family permease n=1 Tax=Actinomadura roseirufa TaxID=2094049 RepID=UPI001F5F0DA3|nr:amino acid permease [Actinomadura roseirufa]